MPVPTLVVARAEFSIEDPWAVPPGCRPTELRRAADGGRPRLPTSVAAYYDETSLTIVFRAVDDEIVATHLGHDDPLWQEDVVEAFLAPADPATYFELEVNPLATTFDARIDSPDGVRATMRADVSWTCEGLFAAVRRAGGVADTVMRIPFASLEAPRPRIGQEWRGNFFRVDRSTTHGDDYSAWSPAMKNPPDFHVVAAFGRLVFT